MFNNMFNPFEILTGTWKVGIGPYEYGIFLLCKSRKKLKYYQKNRKHKKH